MNVIALSGDLLHAVRRGKDTAVLTDQISMLTHGQLAADLRSQEDRLAFWLNIYNACFQIAVRDRPDMFGKKVRLFMGRHFTVAGIPMSLDEIEHDMLRRSTYKWSLGYLQNPFPSKFKKQFRVLKKDPRVHFAMNCGAKSCPPIRSYDPENVREQLDLATRSFLEQEANYDSNTGTVHVTPLFNWFRGDFGGSKGIKAFLYEYDLIPATNVKLRFTKYDWTRQFEHYA